LEGRISTTSIGQGEKTWVRRIFCILCFVWEEEENECVSGELVVMCEKMLFMEENVCKQKNMEGNCV
jgi:hypothetical protein